MTDRQTETVTKTDRQTDRDRDRETVHSPVINNVPGTSVPRTEPSFDPKAKQRDVLSGDVSQCKEVIKNQI